jgi:RNA polymerase sigma-B factor
MREKNTYSDAVVTDLLVQYHQTGEPRIRDQVVEQMRPLVHSVARKFTGREPLEDLESEGYVGLIRAVDRYTPDRGTRFSTFATHLIAGQIRHYLRDRGHLIRQPAWLQELNTRVDRAAAALEQKLERTPTNGELAAATNLTEEAIDELMAARQAAHVLRMDAGAESNEDDFLDVDAEKIRSRDYVTLELPIEDRIVLEGALEKLKELERKVLQGFFYQGRNQSEIARALGISCNYAGYVLRNGLKHMRERLPQDCDPGGLWSVRGREGTVVDGLTGIYNREQFDRRLAEEISRAQRFEHPLSVCCIRLPDQTPDSILQGAAEILRDRTRKADIVARTEACEFGVIFPRTGTVCEEVAVRLAEHLRDIVQGPILVAAATYPDGGRSAERLFAAARAAAVPAGTSIPSAPSLTPAPALVR